uniref:Uncharacterized protein n=1 Tax=Arundo donax TaxID=35708 RepID=A0A0A9G2E4_ARUDO
MKSYQKLAEHQHERITCLGRMTRYTIKFHS